MPQVQTCSPSYRSENDVIVHLRWNAPHKRGGKQSGDVDWSIVTKPCPLSTQEAWLRLRSICNMVSYLTILVLEMVLNATPRHRPQSLINLTGSLYGEAPSDRVSKCKSPWQQRRPCKCIAYVFKWTLKYLWWAWYCVILQGMLVIRCVFFGTLLFAWLISPFTVGFFIFIYFRFTSIFYLLRCDYICTVFGVRFLIWKA